MANLTKVNITINQPAEIVWKKLMDPENLRYWLTGFVSIENISGEPGNPGSVSKLRFLERGKEMELIETAVLVKPPQQYSFNMTSADFNTATDIRLISFGHRTEMIQTVQFFPKQFLMKIIFPILKGVMKKRMLNELIRFKNFVENK